MNNFNLKEGKDGLLYLNGKRPPEAMLFDHSCKTIPAAQLAWYKADCVKLLNEAEKIRQKLLKGGVEVKSCGELKVLTDGGTPSALNISVWIAEHRLKLFNAPKAKITKASSDGAVKISPLLKSLL